MASPAQSLVVAPDRRTARVRGELLYFTGKPCPKGHKTVRYTSNGACVDCLKVPSYRGQSLEIGSPAPKVCLKGHTYLFNPCPTCRKEWNRLDRIAHRNEYTKRQLAKCRVVKRWLNSYKEAHPCTDCHHYFPHYQMEFDHIEPRLGDVSKVVSRAVSTASIRAVIRAIAPCDLVCANCHATRTHFRCGKCSACEEAIAIRIQEQSQIVERIEREYALR